jgi:hypothetical protein
LIQAWTRYALEGLSQSTIACCEPGLVVAPIATDTKLYLSSRSSIGSAVIRDLPYMYSLVASENSWKTTIPRPKRFRIPSSSSKEWRRYAASRCQSHGAATHVTANHRPVHASNPTCNTSADHQSMNWEAHHSNNILHLDAPYRLTLDLHIFNFSLPHLDEPIQNIAAR